jgi:predicted dehydrogenase
MPKTRIAVAGARIIGLAHMEVAQKSPTCALSAIVDPAPATEAIAAKAGVPLYKSLDDPFEKNRPDGVILATPNRLHLEHALKCMAAGTPQLLEKPPSVREAETLVKEADKTGAKVLIGHHRAPSPDHGAREGADRRRSARTTGRRDGQRGLLQAR